MNFRTGSNRLKQCILLLVIWQASAFATAAPVQWRVEDGGNGSWYEIRQKQPDTWNTFHWGIYGVIHGLLSEGLAIVTSAEENRFILDNVVRPFIATRGQESPRFWLGGFINDTSGDAFGRWQWIRPWEEWGYTNWSPRFSEENGLRLSMDADGLWHAEMPDHTSSFAIFEYSFNAAQWRVEEGGNGHWYRLVAGGHEFETWEDKDGHARLQTYGALSGHLATVNDNAENTFIRDILLPRLFRDCRLVSGSHGLLDCWGYNGIPKTLVLGGGYTDREWRWVTGEPWNHNNWAIGQPEPKNDAVVVMQHPGGNNSVGSPIGQWYSEEKLLLRHLHYVIEYEAAEYSWAYRPAHYCAQSEDHCRYRYYLDQPGFYVFEVRLPAGLGDGVWSLSVNTSSGEFAGGFSAGSTLKENGAAPGTITFNLDRREATRLTVQEYTGEITELTVKIQRQETDGTRTVVYGPAPRLVGQAYIMPEFEPGLYIAEVSSDASPRVRFGISINAAGVVGEASIRGWIDSETGGNGAGFTSIYIDRPQFVDLKLLFRRNYGFDTAERGDEGAERPQLALYRQVDEERELLWLPRKEPAAPVAVIELPTRTNELDMRFVLIPAGSYAMGAVDQYGQREVTLTRPFYLQTTETTREQWQAVTGENRWENDNCPRCPANQVSWDEARNFIALLNATHTGEYRLPTEAKWKYAARAGRADPNFYPEGEKDRYGWCGEYNIYESPKRGTFPHPVAKKLPNPWGLYDTNGNTGEWIDNSLDRNHDTIEPRPDPRASEQNKVFCGFKCKSDCANYNYSKSAFREKIGFRLVWEPWER